MDARRGFFKIPNKADVPRITKSLEKYLPIQNKARMDWKASALNLFHCIKMQLVAIFPIMVCGTVLRIRPLMVLSFSPF